jgi:uncharacterized protein YwqG
MSKIQDKLTRLKQKRFKKVQQLSESFQQQIRDILEDEILRIKEEISDQIIEIVENIDDKDSLSGKELDQLKEELYLLAAYISEVSEDETIKSSKASVLIQNSTVTVQTNERGDNIAQDKIEGDKVGRDHITDSR